MPSIISRKVLRRHPELPESCVALLVLPSDDVLQTLQVSPLRGEAAPVEMTLRGTTEVVVVSNYPDAFLA